MKNLRNIAVAFMLFFITGSLAAQTAKTSDIDIKVSSQCGMCKETIERALAFEKGVTKSDLNVETHIIKVTYKPNKTTPETIRKAISLAGYDADDVLADPKAYANLSDCCKKPADRINKEDPHDH